MVQGLLTKIDMNVLYIYLILLCVLSLTAFLLYGADKKKARKGKWRISEKTLLMLGFFGGSIGGLLGMSLFRHKTKHVYFYVVNILGLIWQAFLAYSLLINPIIL